MWLKGLKKLIDYFQKIKKGKIMRRILRKIASDRPDELGDVIKYFRAIEIIKILIKLFF